MKIDLRILLIIITSLLIGCSSENDDSTEGDNTKTTLDFNRTNIDFLDVQKNSSKNETILIENNTSQIVNIDKISLTKTNIFKIEETALSLDSGESFALNIEFNPTAKEIYSEILTIEYNNESIKLNLVGNGINKILDENDSFFGDFIKQNNGSLNLFPDDLETIKKENYDEISVVSLGFIEIENYVDFKNIEFNIDALEILSSKSIDFSGLENIKNLDQLTINSSQTIKNLKGLENISGNVGLSIRNNDLLENLDALEKITSSTVNFVTIESNENLSNFCGLLPLIENDSNISSKLEISNNKFNPTINDISTGKCKI